MSETDHVDSAEARCRLDKFLKRQFGENMSHSQLGPIAIREECTTEDDIMYFFFVNTVKAIESGRTRDGLLSGGIIVPKDGSPVHWAPTFPPVEKYLEEVRSGESWWSQGGADPLTEVKYYALLTPGRTRSNPSGVMRRRTAAGHTTDEVFTRSLEWKPTEYFRKYDLGHNEDEHVEITGAEAAAFIRRIRSRVKQ